MIVCMVWRVFRRVFVFIFLLYICIYFGFILVVSVLFGVLCGMSIG